MGKEWDKDKGGRQQWIAWMTDVARECLRVVKPGGHALVWAIPRTSHWTGMAWEDAGWEPRDKIYHAFGSGFPKSANISVALDKMEQNKWLNICKAIDNISFSDIMSAWKKHLETAKCAALSFQRSKTETGTCTPKSDFVHEIAVLQANRENKNINAIIAELSLSEVRLMLNPIGCIVPGSAEATITHSLNHVTSAERLQGNPNVTTQAHIGTAQYVVKEWQNERTAGKLKAVEALKTWLSKTKSSSEAATNALCAALTDDLKRIILNQSKTFQNYDMSRQTECVSAISVIITEYMAECLISFTVNTLRNEALDKHFGAQREVVGLKMRPDGKAMIDARPNNFNGSHAGWDRPWKNDRAKVELQASITAPATEAAKRYEGYGTALKPAVEEWWLFRKPVEGTIAANVLKHGTGGLNIGSCRVEYANKEDGGDWDRFKGHQSTATIRKNLCGGNGKILPDRCDNGKQSGRYPANLILSDDPEVLACFPVTSSHDTTPGGNLAKTSAETSWFAGRHTHRPPGRGDTGSAARFFKRIAYFSKASKRDRWGLDDVMEYELLGDVPEDVKKEIETLLTLMR